LRRLKSGQGASADHAMRTALAALGLVAVTAQDQQGYFLRSRCDLVPETDSSAAFEIVLADGRVEKLEVTYEEACALLKAAVSAAKAQKLPWREDDLQLVPQPKLVELVLRSRDQAIRGVEEAPAE
jgi:CRISPR-associated protein Csb1